MTDGSARPVNAMLFKNWLLGSGWFHRSEGPLGDLFQFQDATVAIPRDVWRDPVMAHGVAERVARAMGYGLPDVLKRLLSPLTDRVELRLIGESLSSGRVPLGAASEALKNGRRMLSASGTSAIAPTWSIGRHYRPEAQALARDAELAHTEDGSFIFPLYITLDRSDEVPFAYPEDSVIPEPYERRVTRTLATALTTAMRLADESIERLEDAQLDSASSFGVSRELCLSLDELLKSRAVDQLKVTFEWSPAFGTTELLPSAVEIDRDARPQLRALAKRLARPEPIHADLYAGPILEIGHGPDDSEGFHFVLDTYFRERKTKLRVSVSEEEHERAISWYRDRATVIVRGDAMQMASGLLVSDPRRIEAWGDARF